MPPPRAQKKNLGAASGAARVDAGGGGLKTRFKYFKKNDSLGLPFTQVDGGRGGADGLFGLGRGCRLRGPVQQLTPPFFSNHV